MKLTYWGIDVMFFVVLFLSCQQEECQSSPPRYNFAFIDSQGRSVINDSLQATLIRLTSVSSNGIKTVVPVADFKPVASNDIYNFVYTMSYDMFAKSEQVLCTIETQRRTLGTLNLTSRRNNNKCSGCMNLSEVRFNNQQIGLEADNVTYIIKLDL